MPNLLRSHDYAAAENPLSMVAWDAAFWAEDPAWTNPGDGAAVSSWRNAGSNNWGAATSTGSARPLYRASVASMGNRPAIEWDATDDLLRTSVGTPYLTTTHIVVVGRSGSTVNTGEFFNGASVTRRRRLSRTSSSEWQIQAGGGTAAIAAGSNSAVHCFFARYTATSLELILDGTSVASNTGLSTEGIDGITLGAAVNSSGQLEGHLAFVGLKASALTGTEETNLLAWSRSYYGTP